MNFFEILGYKKSNQSSEQKIYFQIKMSKMRVKPWIVFNKNANEPKEYSWIENRKIIFSLIHTIFAIFLSSKREPSLYPAKREKKIKRN